MPFHIDPPLLNSANPWATTIDDIRSLYHSPYTGAVTTRTCTLNGFAHDDTIHQYVFFDPHTLNSAASAKNTGSLNTLGYSPISLPKFVELLKGFANELSNRITGPGTLDKVARKDKPIIISITGSPEELRQCYRVIKSAFHSLISSFPIYIEINLSCPNISGASPQNALPSEPILTRPPGKPPPAYSQAALTEYLHVLQRIQTEHETAFSPSNGQSELHIGIKTPPYTNPDNFTMIRSTLLAFAPKIPISFITATNTLGCSLVLSSASDLRPVLNSSDGSGVGGLAGTPLHPLALGNVRALRRMCDGDAALKGIRIIGVGGVSDVRGFRRMKAVGASAVGVGTALGRKGVEVFEEILREVEGSEKARL